MTAICTRDEWEVRRRHEGGDTYVGTGRTRAEANAYATRSRYTNPHIPVVILRREVITSVGPWMEEE